MSAKSAILSKVRASLGAATEDSTRTETVRRRLAAAPRGVIPERGQLCEHERIALFRQQAEGVSATVETIVGYQDLPNRVSVYLRERNLPASIRMGDDTRLAQADWAKEKTLKVLSGISDGTDMAGLSHAFGAIAETGTLALTAGADNPTTINFLPEYHIVVVDERDIHGDMETVWDRLRVHYGRGTMSRVVNFVTGPSRSADIEQTILLGAHGPRALHIIIVEPDKPH